MAFPTIAKLHLVPGLGAYYREEVSVLQQTPVSLLDRYTTPGHTQKFIREPAHVLCLGAQLVEKQKSLGVAWGDAVGVAFAGKAGREKTAAWNEWASAHASKLESLLADKPVSSYRQLWQAIDGPARALPLSVQYGLSQMCMNAVALAAARTPAEIWCQEYNLASPAKVPAFHGSCGADRHHGALKMMVHRLASHPAGQGDNLPEMLGTHGEKLLEYAHWWAAQVARIDAQYKPTFHFDVHGLIGKIFNDNIDKIAAYLSRLEHAARPYPVRIESALVLPTKQAQLEACSRLSKKLRATGSGVQIVVDEWANTLSDIREFAQAGAVDWIHIKMPDVGPLHDSLEAVLVCKKHAVGALLGGSCIETHTSARASYQLALAVQPDLVLLKPGMGFDEALSLAHNEMHQTLLQCQSTFGNKR